MGENLPEQAFRTSWPTIPPRLAHIGESTEREPDARCLMILAAFSESFSSNLSSSIDLAISKTSPAAAASPGLGYCILFFSAYAAIARYARCNSWGRSNLAKSDIISSPGSSKHSLYVRKLIVTGCFTCVMYPCVAGSEQPLRSSPTSSNVKGPVAFTSYCLDESPSAPSKPRTRENVTQSPVSSPCRPWSSRTLTTAGLAGMTDSTWEVAGFSPSLSETMNSAPKSQNICPNTPVVRE
mmetsp:Transcript_22332/g.66195  ORF Transcript_22332/g.66195 Transcript_22332/m.66195 type:complete len:239 (-) Transcript_22332:473-1189(-)